MHLNKDEIIKSVRTASSVLYITDLHNGTAGYETLRELFDIMAEEDIVRKTMLIISRPDVITEIKGNVPTEIHADVETYIFRDEYDIVVCLGVLPYLTDPVGLIHKLARVSRKKLIIEVASVADRYQYGTRGLRWYEKYVLKRLPVILVGKGIPIAQKRSSVQKYFFTAAALENILLNHTKIFSGVDVINTRSKDRVVVVAKRKYIENLLIVSGPTASGKSTFLEKYKVPGWLDAWYESWDSYLVKNYKNVSIHTVKWPPK